MLNNVKRPSTALGRMKYDLAILQDIVTLGSIREVAEKNYRTELSARSIGVKAAGMIIGLKRQSKAYREALGDNCGLLDEYQDMLVMRANKELYLLAIALYLEYYGKRPAASRYGKPASDQDRIRSMCSSVTLNRVIVMNTRFEVRKEQMLSCNDVSSFLVDSGGIAANVPIFINGINFNEGNMPPRLIRFWTWLLTNEQTNFLNT